MEEFFDVLNENSIKTAMGRNKNRNTKIIHKLSVNLLCFITYLLNHPLFHQFSYIKK